MDQNLNCVLYSSFCLTTLSICSFHLIWCLCRPFFKYIIYHDLPTFSKQFRPLIPVIKSRLPCFTLLTYTNQLCSTSTTITVTINLPRFVHFLFYLALILIYQSFAVTYFLYHPRKLLIYQFIPLIFSFSAKISHLVASTFCIYGYTWCDKNDNNNYRNTRGYNGHDHRKY